MNLAKMLGNLVRGERMAEEDNPTPFNNIAASVGRRTVKFSGRSEQFGNMRFDPSRLRQWQAAVHAVTTSNGIARAATDIVGDFIVGSGLSISTENKALKEVFDAHWYDEMNDWELAQNTRAADIGKMGEQCLRIVLPKPGRGDLVRVAEVPVADILEYRVNKIFQNKVSFIRVRDEDNPSGVWLRVLSTLTDGAFDLDYEDDMVGGESVAGLCLYSTVNRNYGTAVGKPDLLSVVDHLDMLDNLVANVSDRAAFLNSFIWDITVKGDKKAVEKVREEFGDSPPPGSNFVHGDGVSMDTKSPTLNSSDQKGVAELIEAMVFAGTRVAKHWLGRGEGANKATAAEMGDPMFRWLGTRQAGFRKTVEKVIAIQFQVAMERGSISFNDLKTDWKVVAPDVVTLDQNEVSNVMLNFTRAISLARMEGLITFGQALSMYHEAVRKLDIEVPEEEKGNPAESPETSEQSNGKLISLYADTIERIRDKQAQKTG